MAGEVDGADAQEQVEQGKQGEQALEGRPQAEHPVRGPVSNGDWQAQLAVKHEQIEALRAKVAEAAKTTEATEALNAEIAALKQQMADKPVEFALRAAGARSVKAAKALLGEHDGDVAAQVAAGPWLFEGAVPTSRRTSQTSAGGATGLESAGVAGR